jgi:hypothetical protein
MVEYFPFCFFPQVINLNTQFNYFKNMETMLRQKLGEKEAKTLLVKAVYLISIGGNDYFVPFYPNSTVLQYSAQEELVNMVIGNLTTVIKVIAISVLYAIFRINMLNYSCFQF